MALERLLTDTVTLIKQDGTTVEGMKASVQSRKIIVLGQEPLIESGDHVRRKMSNGGEETYEVVDPGFHEGLGGIPAGYQMEVRKLGVPEAKGIVQSVTYNVTGTNARINQNSMDQSVNVIGAQTGVAEKIEELREEIGRVIQDESDRSEALDVVDEIERQLASRSPRTAIVRALVRGLPAGGSIASIGSFLLSCLG